MNKDNEQPNKSILNEEDLGRIAGGETTSDVTLNARELAKTMRPAYALTRSEGGALQAIEGMPQYGPPKKWTSEKSE